MFKVVLLLLALALPCGLLAQEPEKTVTDPWAGRYKLWIGEDQPYHQNALVLTQLSGEELVGTLELDKGLGPEAESPGPDHIVHKLQVRGKRKGADSGFIVETPVGTVQTVLYRFELLPVEPQRSLAGTVYIGNQKFGVYARREGVPENQ